MRVRFGKTCRILLTATLLASMVASLGPADHRGVAAQTPSYRMTVPLVADGYGLTISEPHPFGAQMYGDLDCASMSIDGLRQARLHWVRWEVNWGQVVGSDETAARDPNPVYNWYLDASARRAQELGLELIVTFVTNPLWASIGPTGSDTRWVNGPIASEALPVFANMVAAMAARYPWIRYYEFFNEPDNANELQAQIGGPYWGPYPDRYAAMLRAVYPALKDANPDAQVVFGGLAYDFFDETGDGSFRRSFLDDVLQDPLGAPFDVFNFHYYPAFAHSWESQYPGDTELVAKAHFLRDKLATLGRPGVPMMCTEVGMGSEPGTIEEDRSPVIQARYVTQTAARALAAGLDAVIWFAWKDLAADSDYAHYGLLTRALAAKPSVAAFRAATLELGAATYLEPFVQDGIEGYALRDAAGNPLYVLWSRDAQSPAVTLDATRASVTRYDGTTLPELTDAGDGWADGRVTFPVGPDPVYVEVR